MPALFGRHYSRAELLARTGRLDAIAGITPYVLEAGASRGVRAFAGRTGDGLTFDVVADRALDVVSASYRGTPLSWSASNAVVAGGEVDECGDAFLKTFLGGLFTTCGLGNFGPAGSDEWGAFGLHGRIDATPAEQTATEVRWSDDANCVLTLTGTMRETRVFGERFRLDRTLSAPVGGKTLAVHDEVTNEAGVRRPHMILYHCNGGFPILGPETELHVSHVSVKPRDAEAASGLDRWNRGGEPDATFKEQVFIHEPVAARDGLAFAALWNPALNDGQGLGWAVRFNPAQLPSLFTWRMLGHSTYVMAMEPANCPTIEGRVEAALRGTLPFLAPGETCVYDLSFVVLTSRAELDALHLPFDRAETP